MSKKIDTKELLRQIEEGLTPSELAKYFGVRKSAISNRLKRLQQKGIIELSTETYDKRLLLMGNYKVFKLTKKGRLLLRGGDAHPLATEKIHAKNTMQISLDDFSPSFEEPDPIVEIHGVAFIFSIDGMRGSIPPTLREQRMQNWTKYHGMLAGCYVAITTKNVIVYPRAEGSTAEEAWENAKQKVAKVWQLLRHYYGWEISSQVKAINPTTGKIYGISNVPGAERLPSPQEGLLTKVDNTPYPKTIHLKTADITDADAIVYTSRWWLNNKDKIVLRSELNQTLNQTIQELKQAVVQALTEAGTQLHQPAKPDERRDVA